MAYVAGSKRSCAAVTEDEDDVLIISLGQGIKFLSGNSYVLRCYSICARHLPPEATVWDLSSLLVDVRPPAYDTVATWLDVLYMVHEGDTTPQSRGNQHNLDTLDGVCQLLAFADAVGSSRGIIKACLRVCKMQSLFMPFQAEGKTINLLLDGRCYVCPEAGGSLVEHYFMIDGGIGKYNHAGRSDTSASSISITAEERVRLVTDLGDGLERAAYLGHKLQLQPLQHLVTMVISSSVLFNDALLSGQLDRVFTLRVREAAGLADDQVFAKHIKCLTEVQVLPNPTSPNSLFMNTQVDVASLVRGSHLHMRLQRSLLGAPPGQVVRVQVRLEEGFVVIGGLSLPVDLVLRSKA